MRIWQRGLSAICLPVESGSPGQTAQSLGSWLRSGDSSDPDSRGAGKASCAERRNGQEPKEGRVGEAGGASRTGRGSSTWAGGSSRGGRGMAWVRGKVSVAAGRAQEKRPEFVRVGGWGRNTVSSEVSG